MPAQGVERTGRFSPDPSTPNAAGSKGEVALRFYCAAARLSRYSAPSSSTAFLCLGFLRSSFGTITRDEGTIPTRSRASFLISFLTSNFGFFLAIALLPARHRVDVRCKSFGFPGRRNLE